MKIHITNLYTFNKKDSLIDTQNHFADAGRQLGFIEMGIFNYPVETDSVNELSKRLDGIIASLEFNDIVIYQLPTKNGYVYDRTLINKILSYKDTKLILLIHDMNIILSDSETAKLYIDICKTADCIVVPNVRDKNILHKYSLKKIISYEKTKINKIYYNKILLDATDIALGEKPSDNLLSNELKDEIQIGFGLHDKSGDYSVWVGTVMQSIVDNTNAPICFHILHDDTLNNDNKTKLTYIANHSGHRIKYHFIDKTLFDDVANQVNYFTVGTMFRVMLPELLPDIDRIIYLDADLLVNRDIKELWDININDYYMAAVPDHGITLGTSTTAPIINGKVLAKEYFNAGVLYINLNNVRKKGNMKNLIIEYLINVSSAQLPDQDALNVIYNGGIFYLDESWNFFATEVRNRKEKKLEQRIYHYAGTKLKLYYETAMDMLYLETINRTPWGFSDCKSIIDSSLLKTTYRANLLEKLLPLITNTNKKRIFYGAETYAMRNLYNLISIRENDYRIMDEDCRSIDGILPEKTFDTLANEKDEYIVFVLPQADGDKALDKLNNLGLKRDIDYFVIPCLLMPEQGGYR